MTEPGHGPHSVLFLCTGNSARSIMAEALLNGLGRGRFRAYSAGSHPVGQVNPLALAVLEREGLPLAGLRSKSWDEFARPGAPPIDFVFTVCDNAAAETCPVWPGGPLTLHWGVPDPAAVAGPATEQRRAFELAYSRLRSRICALASLELASLDAAARERALAAIGTT